MSRPPRPDFIVTADVYNACEVGVFLDAARFAAWGRWYGADPGDLRDAAAAAHDFRDGDGLARFGVFVPPGCDPVRVGHECLHIGWKVLDVHGVEVDADNHEAFAYLQQHLARQILAKLPTS